MLEVAPGRFRPSLLARRLLLPCASLSATTRDMIMLPSLGPFGPLDERFDEVLDRESRALLHWR
jgi:hypothetical protein